MHYLQLLWHAALSGAPQYLKPIVATIERSASMEKEKDLKRSTVFAVALNEDQGAAVQRLNVAIVVRQLLALFILNRLESFHLLECLPGFYKNFYFLF